MHLQSDLNSYTSLQVLGQWECSPRIPFIITKTRLFKYIENFTTKNWKFSDKNSDIFRISAQNIEQN